MNKITSKRIESIDILRGLVMVIMALDHVRDYFHSGAFTGDPENIDTTTPILFFTRFITHFCAPVFIFLAGTSAFLYGQKRSNSQLSKFLVTRGIWLIFVEIFIMNFLWWFDVTYSFVNLQVIWAIGWCMIVLGIAIHLPKKLLLFLGLLIVLGHNGLDGIQYQYGNIEYALWYAFHQIGGGFLTPDHFVQFTYPILPWIGVIFLGYGFGSLYQKGFDLQIRKKWLLYLGLSSIALFFIVRYINIYGNLYQWEVQDTATKTVISFFKITKYPPSLQYLLITLGPAFLFLYFMENVQNKITNFLLAFGRVPFFYYILHVLVIHGAAVVGLLLTSKDWTLMIITRQKLFEGKLAGYGYDLWIVYLVWIGVVLLLYPICKKYMKYKAAHKDKWWLSYL
jgi:uncharacterized membrane protein